VENGTDGISITRSQRRVTLAHIYFNEKKGIWVQKRKASRGIFLQATSTQSDKDWWGEDNQGREGKGILKLTLRTKIKRKRIFNPLQSYGGERRQDMRLKLRGGSYYIGGEGRGRAELWKKSGQLETEEKGSVGNHKEKKVGRGGVIRLIRVLRPAAGGGDREIKPIWPQIKKKKGKRIVKVNEIIRKQEKLKPDVTGELILAELRSGEQTRMTEFSNEDRFTPKKGGKQDAGLMEGPRGSMKTRKGEGEKDAKWYNL